VFFPKASPAAQLLASFTTFAAAFLIRPVGGVVFGPLGDRIGRQRVLAATMILMAASTFSIGLIPGYGTIGVAAPVLLLLARMAQGFSTGGEYGGATTFVSEYAPDRHRGFVSSWLDFGTFVGYAAGSGLVTGLTSALGDTAMTHWGWRLPFLLAGPIGVIGLYVRLRLEDTPAFRQRLEGEEADEDGGAPEQRPPGARRELAEIITRQWRPLLVCVGLVLLYNVTNYMVTAYLPTYLHSSLHRSTTSADTLVLVAMLAVVALITWLGRLSDLVGRRRVFLVAGCAQIALAYPAFVLLRGHGFWPPLAGALVLAVLLAAFAAPSAATLPALFPTRVRYGAMAIGFNVSVSLFGGTTPLVNEALVSATGDLMVPAYYLMAAGAIGVAAAACLKETARLPLRGSPPMVSTGDEARALVASSERAMRGLRTEGRPG
jgi:MHS family proline/betaine transporter-like MFS transporter